MRVIIMFLLLSICLVTLASIFLCSEPLKQESKHFFRGASTLITLFATLRVARNFASRKIY